MIEGNPTVALREIIVEEGARPLAQPGSSQPITLDDEFSEEPTSAINTAQELQVSFYGPPNANFSFQTRVHHFYPEHVLMSGPAASRPGVVAYLEGWCESYVDVLTERLGHIYFD
jgi:hypothetical protein